MALCVGLGNTAFVGYPLLAMLGGPSPVAIGAVVDQLGTFVMVSLGAVPLGTHLSGRNVPLAALRRRRLTFPSMMALGVLRLVHSGGGEIDRVTVAQAAMAPMVSAGVLAGELNLDARLASALIALGTIISLGTVPLRWRLLS